MVENKEEDKILEEDRTKYHDLFIEIGLMKASIAELINSQKTKVINGELNKSKKVTLILNDKRIASGEITCIGGIWGFKILEIY